MISSRRRVSGGYFQHIGQPSGSLGIRVLTSMFLDRYALISPLEEASTNESLPKFRVIDMETFLQELLRNGSEEHSFWAQQGAPLTEKVGAQEVQDLMPVVRKILQGTRDYWPYDVDIRR